MQHLWGEEQDPVEQEQEQAEEWWVGVMGVICVHTGWEGMSHWEAAGGKVGLC